MKIPLNHANPRLKLMSETHVDFTHGRSEGQPSRGKLYMDVGGRWTVTITRAGTVRVTYFMALPSISPQN